MNSKLSKFTFKSMLLQTLILGGILVVAAFLIGVTTTVQDEFYKTMSGGVILNTYIVSEADSGLAIFTIFALVAAYIMGLTIFTYRQSIKKADLFYQIPYGEKSLRNTRILIGLLYISIIFTISFTVLVSVYGFRVLITPEVKNTAHSIFVRATIQPQYYLLAFIVGLTSTCATYLITCFFASTASSLENSIAISIEGFLILGGTAFVLFYGLWEVEAAKTDYAIEGGVLDNVAHNFGLSPYQVIGFISIVTNRTAVGGEPVLYPGELETLIADVTLYTILGGILLIPLLLAREPSAETCGKGFGHNKFDRIVHHITFGLICFLIYVVIPSESIPVFAIFYLIVIVIYLLSTAGLNRTFRLKINDFLPIIISGSSTILSSLIYMVWYTSVSY